MYGVSGQGRGLGAVQFITVAGGVTCVSSGIALCRRKYAIDVVRSNQ